MEPPANGPCRRHSSTSTLTVCGAARSSARMPKRTGTRTSRNARHSWLTAGFHTVGSVSASAPSGRVGWGILPALQVVYNRPKSARRDGPGAVFAASVEAHRERGTIDHATGTEFFRHVAGVARRGRGPGGARRDRLVARDGQV